MSDPLKYPLSSLAHTARTRRTLALLEWRQVVFFVSTACLSYFFLWLLRWLRLDSVVDERAHWTPYCLVFILYAPLINTAFCSSFALKSTLPQNADPVRPLKKLYICSVTRGTNADAVLRCFSQMRNLAELDPRISLCILTDEPHGADFRAVENIAKVIATPESFRPFKAMYKARALEWFRRSAELADNDWILHLDEETVIDEHTLEACIHFAERQDAYEYGQGIIMYNSHGFWGNTLTTIGDISRVRDDFARYFWNHNYIHVPTTGLHGSFLLTSGRVENAVTWDTASTAEDMWFGLEAWKMNMKGGWIPSIAREQSPYTVRDFWKQRSRWFTGMSRVQGLTSRITVVMWCLEAIGSPIIIVLWHQLRIPYWMYMCAVTINAAEVCSLWFACIIQDLDAELNAWSIILHAIFCPWAAVVEKWLEATLMIYNLIKPTKGFYIVSK